MLTDADNGQKVITKAHPEHSSGELKILCAPDNKVLLASDKR